MSKTLAIRYMYCCDDDTCVQYVIPKEHVSKSTRKFLKKHFRRNDLSDRAASNINQVIREVTREIPSTVCSKEMYYESNYQFWSRCC